MAPYCSIQRTALAAQHQVTISSSPVHARDSSYLVSVVFGHSGMVFFNFNSPVRAHVCWWRLVSLRIDSDMIIYTFFRKWYTIKRTFYALTVHFTESTRLCRSFALSKCCLREVPCVLWLLYNLWHPKYFRVYLFNFFAVRIEF